MTTTQERIGGYMLTFSNTRFFPEDFRVEDVRIEDIAHSLSNLCRFGGHVKRGFYSVAQHSVHVSHLLPPRLALAGLLHDATEAYLVDLPRPVKAIIPQYKELESRIASVIAERFRVNLDDPLIKWADNTLLVTEARDLMDVPEWELRDWSDVKPIKDKIIGLDPKGAENAFLWVFNCLSEESYTEVASEWAKPLKTQGNAK